MNLLNLDENPKTVKGQKKNYRTAILYLAPHKLSGKNMCPYATPGCVKACLNTAGFGGIFPSVQEGRIRKTRKFLSDRNAFMQELESEIEKFIIKTKKEARQKRKKIIPVIRLNGTSDISWEKISYTYNGVKRPNIMARFPNIQFYDYTKNPNRSSLPENYKLTFSLAENNDGNAKSALRAGMNLAVVFRKDPPVKFWGRKVINADDDDLRFLDPPGVICGLKAKGKARKDSSGFVRSNSGRKTKGDESWKNTQ